METLGFTDSIFAHTAEALTIPPRITRYVFVNQFYYTALEKSMIQLLEQAKCGIEILFQGEEEWFDLQNLKVRDPDFRKLLKDRRYRLQSLLSMKPQTGMPCCSAFWQLSRRKTGLRHKAMMPCACCLISISRKVPIKSGLIPRLWFE